MLKLISLWPLEMTGIPTGARIIQEQSCAVSSKARSVISSPYFSMPSCFIVCRDLGRDKEAGIYWRSGCVTVSAALMSFTVSSDTDCTVIFWEALFHLFYTTWSLIVIVLLHRVVLRHWESLWLFRAACWSNSIYNEQVYKCIPNAY